MAIDLKHFVDISMKYRLSTSASADRDTATLIINGDTNSNETYSSLSGVLDAFESDNRFKEGGELYYYVYCFFKNGGINLQIIVKATGKTAKYTKVEDETRAFSNNDLYSYYMKNNVQDYYLAVPTNANKGNALYEATSEEPVTYVPTEDPTFVANKVYYKDSEGTTIATPVNCELYTKSDVLTPLTQEDVEGAITTLDYTKIVIASNASYSIMAKVAGSVNQGDDFDMNSKIILSCIPEGTDIATVSAIEYRGFVVKYGVCGIEMAVAAYLTQINANAYNSVQDYYFTTENVVYEYNDENIGYVCDDNALATALMEKQINFNSMLVNEVRNIGGNTTKGKNFVNEFMLILLHQTLTNRLVQLLTQKLKYNQTGLSLIGATISDELHRYLNNGYLTTEKSWTDPDLIVDGITVISKNTPLQLGYKYVILPFSTLTAEERREHKLPKIYILIADSYAIRKIEITGEVI